MKACYCGSGQSYAQCCQPFHKGLKTPTSPEALMRSRYAAYCVADIAYIQATMRDKASLGFDPTSAKLWAERVIWVKLQVLHTEQASSTQGFVEFIASFVDGKTLQHMREISEFLYTDGRWFYVDGKPNALQPSPTSSILSRNSPCPCDSGKKWKYCHSSVY
ncbi:MAG: YchJ family protein [Legionellales bacterium]|nr:YchJ family protein [Legionellales bacterium]